MICASRCIDDVTAMLLPIVQSINMRVSMLEFPDRHVIFLAFCRISFCVFIVVCGRQFVRKTQSSLCVVWGIRLFDVIVLTDVGIGVSRHTLSHVRDFSIVVCPSMLMVCGMRIVVYAVGGEFRIASFIACAVLLAAYIAVMI